MHLDKFRKQSKQLELWKVITLASHYMKLMDSTRPRHVRQAVAYMRELDAAAYRIDSTIETLDQITNEVDNEIGCCAANFKKSFVTKANALESCGLYQLSVQLQKQQKSINDVADDFSRRIRLINGMHDNFKEHKSLLKKCRVFDVDMSAFTKLVRLQCGQLIAPVKERYPVEDLKTLSLVDLVGKNLHRYLDSSFLYMCSNSFLQVIDELNKVIVNLNGLRMVRKLIASTTSPEQNDIAKLMKPKQNRQCQLPAEQHVSRLIRILPPANTEYEYLKCYPYSGNCQNKQ
ncbi:unnamed protein product [Acanthocheilonema viteae]|uniref:Uncharacterized protein n=1 Tax=Acanthocheilonema viteae TaxID=6277 RepID=A0A498S6U7_ACAVI|nr:unnamed protein product [Acanthocheilonema viteae]